jgi:predicted PP-loop superfamily ATPase
MEHIRHVIERFAMDQVAEVFEQEGVLTDLMSSGSGFVTMSDGRMAFVLPSLIRRMALQPGDRMLCRLVPNFPDKTTDRVPWRVIFVKVVQRASGGFESQGALDEVVLRVLTFLEDRGGAWTAGDIAAEMGALEERFVYQALNLLQDRDQVSSARLRACSRDKRDIETFWSVDYEALLPVGALEEEEEDHHG